MSYIVNHLVVTNRGSQEIVISVRGSEQDEDVTLDDYGCGNGGFIQTYVPGEWDWFLEIDWKDITAVHGMMCRCKQCRAYWKPMKLAAKEWLIRNRVFAPVAEDLGIGVTAMQQGKFSVADLKRESVPRPKRLSIEEIDKQINILNQMKKDSDLTTA